MNSASGLLDRLVKHHALHCADPTCPYAHQGESLVLTESFDPDDTGIGGAGHRNLYSLIGCCGEYLAHLSVPQIRLQGDGVGAVGPMDGASPRGETEIKTATLCTPARVPQWAFTVRPRQRRVHALPLICIGLDDEFIEAFRGKPVVLPESTAAIAEHVHSLFTIPLATFPYSTFVVPADPSPSPNIRSIQKLFSMNLSDLSELGLDGLCRLRGIWTTPERIETARRFIGRVEDDVSDEELAAYRLEPHRLLAVPRRSQVA